MGLKETLQAGKVFEHPDGGLIARSVLAKAFDCSPFAVERVLKRASVEMVQQTSPDGNNTQPFVPVDMLPRVIASILKNPGDKKLKDRNIDTSQDFKVTTANGTVYEYAHPKK